ncbi:hypothetical protein BayCH28_25570 [Mycolicibacterium sp. CH28]|uniref:hypothetical protein n=1 Tax=Mycolicibacterium sp. CH28 TaxID=2512237 RepID=UPI001080BA0D|nr:hypothetical protein [Mycolicibacterium sp. CH28]TGD84400.1 hypothetical protein BayCH28_25570 [Mycolicibacterium sp. CH28]
MMIGVAAALLACIGYGVSSVLQAYGARRSAAAARDRGATGHVTATGGPTLRSTMRAALTAAFIAGVVLDVVGFAGSAVSARLIPLFLSQTIISANLVVTAVLGIAVLGIGLRRRDWIAIGTVIVSLFVLGLGSGERGGVNPDRLVHWGVLAGSVLILLGGIALVRFLGSRGAIMAGLIAGVLFGGLAIAVRVLDGLDPLQPWVLAADPAAWAVVISGVGGFYLHTVALQLGSVNGATAALVVGETVVPGIIGVVFLGDSAQPGLGWVVALGFVGAVAGAVAVAVFGAAGHGTTQAGESKTEVPAERL